MKIFEFVLLVVGSLSMLGGGWAFAQSAAETPRYVGSNVCAECHSTYVKSWKQSHHAWAWNVPDERHVLADFSGTRFDSPNLSARFYRNGSQFIVETLGRTGKQKDFPVHSTVGVAPLQQYLLEVEKGRLQAFDLVWDVENRRWYHLYPDQKVGASDGLHWTGPYKNWNARCAECHSTGYAKNYSPRDRKYSSTQAEISVGCEACHGPAEAHVAWAKAAPSSKPRAAEGLTDKGLTIAFSASSPEREIQMCATCHSRREALSDKSPVPGTAYHDAYQLALLRPGLYHADGAILDEVFVYGSFVQSKMYANGVRCSDCHDSHSGRLKADGNAVCTQCHSPAGNTRFPSLKNADYDTPAHHFHKAGSEGAQCRSCHMIERVYMGVDGRRDHSFRKPRPDLSPKTGAPNACNDCHTDLSPTWAANEIAKRFPDSQRDPNHFSVVFARARQDPASQVAELFAVANDAETAGIVRATALDLLRNVTNPDIADRATSLVRDPVPMVRAAALRLQRGGRPIDIVPRILPLLVDRYRSVRINAALVLSGMPIARLPQPSATALADATREWQASLLSRADFPETHLVLGGVALTRRNLNAAESAFREAVRQDPQLVDAWRMLIEIDLARRNTIGAARTADDALAANPDDEQLKSIARQLVRPR